MVAEQQQGRGWMPGAILLIVETATEVKPQVLTVPQKRISEVHMKLSWSSVRTNFRNDFREGKGTTQPCVGVAFPRVALQYLSS